MAVPLDEDSNCALSNLITRQIAESSSQRITFADYMDLALYHPLHGYYAANVVNIGKKDFFTSPYLGADFGELLAEQFVQMWEILQQPSSFSLVEMGAGQGLLAFDVLRYLRRKHPKFLESLDYIIVERAAALIVEQKKQLQPLQETGVSVRWCSLEDIASNSITGCFFSNELVDALPVHLVTVAAGQLNEIYVAALDEGGNSSQFVEVVDELSTPALVEYFDLIDINLLSSAYPDHYRTEVNLAALSWLETVANRLQRGYILTIDYGYSADRYYSPIRSQGTLQCYYQHAHHSDPYIHIGQQDITAHVDFTALERQGGRCGLKTLGFTQQGLFLLALGLGDRIAALRDTDATSTPDIQTTLRRRDALHQLANPMGLGNFGVLIQSKGLSSQESVYPLKGLNQPAM